MNKKKWRNFWRKWFGDWKLAFSGVALAFKKPKFCLVAGSTFLIFGILMNLLSGGTAAFNLIAVVDFPEKLKIIFDAFLSLFGVGRAFLDWALYFSIALLQGILVGLVALVWKKRKDKATRDSNSDNLQRSVLSAGFAVLGSGCPTCGTTLLAPLIGAVSSSGGLALAGALSGLLTTASYLIALFTLKKIGKEAYIELVAETYSPKPTPNNSQNHPNRKEKNA